MPAFKPTMYVTKEAFASGILESTPVTDTNTDDEFVEFAGGVFLEKELRRLINAPNSYPKNDFVLVVEDIVLNRHPALIYLGSKALETKDYRMTFLRKELFNASEYHELELKASTLVSSILIGLSKKMLKLNSALVLKTKKDFKWTLAVNKRLFEYLIREYRNGSSIKHTKRNI